MGLDIPTEQNDIDARNAEHIYLFRDCSEFLVGGGGGYLLGKLPLENSYLTPLPA